MGPALGPQGQGLDHWKQIARASPSTTKNSCPAKSPTRSTYREKVPWYHSFSNESKASMACGDKKEWYGGSLGMAIAQWWGVSWEERKRTRIGNPYDDRRRRDKGSIGLIGDIGDIFSWLQPGAILSILWFVSHISCTIFGIRWRGGLSLFNCLSSRHLGLAKSLYSR